MKKKVMFGLAIVFVVIITGIFVYQLDQKAKVLNELPNYTDDKQKIVVDGFKYENQPHLGDSNAKVKVIEFGDFKCPACKKWTLENFQKFKLEFIDTGKVEFFFMNYAFIDRDSYLAGAAGESIYHQNNEKFWEFYELLYKNQGKETEIWATPTFLTQFVKDNIKDINQKQFELDVKNHTYLHSVKEDYKIGGFYGVNGTPTFIVNGKILRSSSYEDIKASILKELN
ncbi:DsbA family protein [Paenibacillus terrae]|uniref:Disulfide bond formation protein DsbB n=1 Tax=Paenibacillus terrae TaxID=159743 RepID=A0A0D7WZ34_9BACL|nr:DsbA family protein [Paenibacillus terrae]KJD43978.1 disulfide bond formation protein DsbB [Paenibacillus terrae]